MKEELEKRIDKLAADIENRIIQECAELKEFGMSGRVAAIYAKRLRWDKPELAAYVRERMVEEFL